MNTNFKGMNPTLAKAAMELIQTKKAELDRESNAASLAINEAITNAFAGAQTSAMQGFVTSINSALQNLYKYLDGADSNFAANFNKVIASYEESDANVSATYSNSAQ